MKKLMLFLYVTIIISCSKNVHNDNDEVISMFDKEFPQNWSLLSISENNTGNSINGSDLPYQEFFVLNSDNTFMKTRTSETINISVTGVFEIDLNDSDQNLKLIYNQQSQIIENCSNDITEVFRVISNELISGGKIPCDGPGYLYKKNK